MAGLWEPPRSGDKLTAAGGLEQSWEPANCDEQGGLKDSLQRGGYVYWPVCSERRQVMILEAAGHRCVYVNGDIRAGDPYGHGYLHLPVLLQQGTNQFLFQAGRGNFRARLVPAPGPLVLETADSTLPDIIAGENDALWGATVILNATTNSMLASLHAVGGESSESLVTIPPLGICKAPWLLSPPGVPQFSNTVSIALEAADVSGGSQARVRSTISLRVRQPTQTHRRTFRSEIDNSVQYYALNLASVAAGQRTRPALFLSLHGAGVEAQGQADAYSPKPWGHIVCPTNRRPYGFDWEEWGRWDAIEVLGLAATRLDVDPARIYLTGHSMGGHGTWQLGALLPGRFAAIGPSAGWISFRSYAVRERSPGTNAVEQMLLRAAAASDTLLMATNYLEEGVYILHGDADDNVPVSEARAMRKVLAEFHRDFDYHEQPGAGHWWPIAWTGRRCLIFSPDTSFPQTTRFAESGL